MHIWANNHITRQISLIFLLLLFVFANVNAKDVAPFKVVKIVDGLNHPWALEFLPDDRLLITERSGSLRIVYKNKIGRKISGLPKIASVGQGGLLDVALHLDFIHNQLVYLSYVTKTNGRYGTEVGRGKLIDNKIINWKKIFSMQPKTRTNHHFGSRLIVDKKHLYITLGDRGNRHDAQDLSNHAGSVVRLNHDGTIPSDNPFINNKNVKPEIFSLGHRNIQGAVKNHTTGKIWLHEHGPQGGDELNILKAGANYGWPVITYGREYGIGFKIGEGTHKKGMLQPEHYWVPSIAPSGMDIYRGNIFAGFEGDILLGSLKFGLLVRLSTNQNKIIKEYRYLHGKYGRIRDVKVDDKGYIWLLTDDVNGQLLKLVPK